MNNLQVEFPSQHSEARDALLQSRIEIANTNQLVPPNVRARVNSPEYSIGYKAAWDDALFYFQQNAKVIEVEEEEYDMCFSCNGTGEGMTPDTSCTTCRGYGTKQ